MKSKTIIEGVIFSLVLLSFTYNAYSYLITGSSIEVDATGTATYIIDGDTFEVSTGERVRLADVNCAERGEPGSYEATEFLSSLIYNRRVYLDIDDYYTTGPYGRLICVVYVDFNSTHYLNVNGALLAGDFAYVSDYDNEFNPYRWTLFVEKVSSVSRVRLLGIAIGVGFVITLIGFGIYRAMFKVVRGQIRAIFGR